MLSTRPLIKFSVEHPWIVIIISLLVTLAFVLPLPGLKIQADVQTLLPEDVAEVEDHISGISDNYDKLLVMVKGESLFTVKNLQLFESVFHDLEDYLPVINTIDPFSLMTLEKSGGRLIAVTMAPGGVAPQNDEDLQIFIRRLKNARFAQNLITSDDFDSIAVYLSVEKTEAYIKSMSAVHEILSPLEQDLEVSVTGTSPFSAETERFLTTGFARLLVFVILTILVSYFIGFRSKRAVFIPITLVISGTIIALGTMALAGFKVTMVSIISPPLILTLGSSYSIHVMNSYYSAAALCSWKEKKNLIMDSVNSISGTVLLASATTLIGLLSLLFASIRQTREFAVATALGIFFSALLSVTLLPAFLSLQSVPDKKRLNILSQDVLAKFLKKFGMRLTTARFIPVIIIILITVVFIVLTPRVEFNTSPAKYFPESSRVIKNLKEFISEFGGYDELEIKLKGSVEDYFLDKDVLENINEIENELKDNPNISYVLSFSQYLEYASIVLTGGEQQFQSAGFNRFISRIFTVANPEGNLVKKDYSEITIFIRVLNRAETMPLDEKVTQVLQNELAALLNEKLLADIDWELSGTSLGFLKLSGQMRRDFLVSTLAALLMIGTAASIAFKSVFKGILALVPLLMGIFASMIFMVIFDIPLDMTTIMVSCITIGVGVDDSIHFLLQHRKYEKEFPDDSVKAVYETLLHTGRPIVITTLSIIAGLIFLAFAVFQPIRYFGLLIVFTLLTACFSTIVLLPPLLRLTGKRKDAAHSS